MESRVRRPSRALGSLRWTRPLSCWTALSLALFGSSALQAQTLGETPQPSEEQVAEHYAQLALEMYGDALRSARILQRAIESFVAAPSRESHATAQKAWIDARKVYSQTEAFRFGNANVDAWEGQVNAWPIDEGFLDYTASGYVFDVGNPHASASLVSADVPLDAGSIRLRHEEGGLEPNVATGFHAIEFLLWGQDLNEVPTAAGRRPYTDYRVGDGCTHGSCDRRGTYLRVVASLLVFDLRNMVEDWRTGWGGYRDRFAMLPPRERLHRMVEGLGTMSGGELAGERLHVALIAHSQEDEQSCFSDTTHWDVLYNARGIRNLYLGRYVRSDGVTVEGPALSSWVAGRAPELDARIRESLDRTQSAAEELARVAEAGSRFDHMIRPENAADRARIEHLIGLLAQQAEHFDSVRGLLGPRASARASTP